MKRVYAPWRHDYVTKKEDPSGKSRKELKNECVFCEQFAQNDDEKYLILKRFEHCAAIMNYYPYNSGHMMVLPFEHVGNLYDLTAPVRAQLMEVTNTSIEIIEPVLKCEGVNVGINLGVAGGGGIRQHLHIHILPRWSGDTNFLATLGDTKLLCSDFQKNYELLKERFDEL